MFGQYKRNIDDKKRLALPSKLRDDLGSKIYLTVGLEGIVEIRSEKEFNKFVEVLNQQNSFDTNARFVRRFWLSNTQEIELDNQGRFVVPKQFLDKAAIQKEAIFVASGNLVELWGSEKFDQYCQNFNDSDISSAAQKILERSGK
ncbi:division/cell wall cluster transcriptional repressor MraZ [Mycoplasmopsis fermentans]|nr:division/cell wall cluster transcriptional repressor MraZ [Mycoplasmopsis fermentans]VEU66726.1 cell division protein MraZ [Mesomycoplasma conjunctivae]ADN69022.1 putative mraZ protein [Mycoplasmopsis fermentans JER]ADV34531.1 Protein MraZ [Mycoplasmopsis fermentans M64]RMX35372.1 mraZ family protein [Mycoplasmopsis fermentans MF-I1]RMX35570.1 mraZ family protein [Mycoplasmopsis fermentans MF-I2]